MIRIDVYSAIFLLCSQPIILMIMSRDVSTNQPQVLFRPEGGTELKKSFSLGSRPKKTAFHTSNVSYSCADTIFIDEILSSTWTHRHPLDVELTVIDWFTKFDWLIEFDLQKWHLLMKMLRLLEASVLKALYQQSYQPLVCLAISVSPDVILISSSIILPEIFSLMSIIQMKRECAKAMPPVLFRAF